MSTAKVRKAISLAVFTALGTAILSIKDVLELSLTNYATSGRALSLADAPIGEDETYLLLLDEHYDGLDENCDDILDNRDWIKKIHFHVTSCKAFDKSFGNRLGSIYGVKMLANAMNLPFEFTCGLGEGETPNGAAYLMMLNSIQDDVDPPPTRDGMEFTPENVCHNFCDDKFCTWHSRNLDLASESMISDWKKLAIMSVPENDDAVIHLRLGDAMYSPVGRNQGKGLFPHATYVNLLLEAQKEKGTINSIGIVTAPFRGPNVRRHDRDDTLQSEVIALDLMIALQLSFPEAEITIHNEPEQTIVQSLARLVKARKVAICGCSTFCPYALLATEGIGYLYHSFGADNRWVTNASRRYANFRLFEAPLLNGLLIENKKTGEKLDNADVMEWLQNQDPDVGHVDIVEQPILRYQ